MIVTHQLKNDALTMALARPQVGGGTAGLCIAASLTEHPDVKVAVLEAGADRMSDPNVSTPALYPTVSCMIFQTVKTLR